jgi:hypothetical protein
VATGILRGFGIPRPLQPLLTRASQLSLATPEDGARTAIQLATSPDLAEVTGQYFVRGKPASSPEASYNRNLQEALWTASEYLTRLAPGLEARDSVTRPLPARTTDHAPESVPDERCKWPNTLSAAWRCKRVPQNGRPTERCTSHPGRM